MRHAVSDAWQLPLEKLNKVTVSIGLVCLKPLTCDLSPRPCKQSLILTLGPALHPEAFSALNVASCNLVKSLWTRIDSSKIVTSTFFGAFLFESLLERFVSTCNESEIKD